MKNIVEKIVKLAEIPNGLVEYIEALYSSEDMEIIKKADENGYIGMENISEEVFLKAYQRGVLDKCSGEQRYKISSVFTRIDCLIRGEQDLYHSFPNEIKEAIIQEEQDIDIWVMPKRKKNQNMSIIHPLPLENALDILRNHDGIFYAQDCDCKIFHNDQKHMRSGCLFLKKRENLDNTNLDRGYGRELSLKEAEELMTACDKDGLVHNLEHNSFCNCCACCCWAFRGIKKFEDKGYPLFEEYIESEYVIKSDVDKCRGCGRCVEICPMGALSVNDCKIVINDRCIGCGVCRTKCNFGALEIKSRSCVC